jgi:hypothetical protein
MSAAERIHVPGKPIGRHVSHDERSRAFPAPEFGGPTTSIFHPRKSPPFNQRQLGSCTGNAGAGCVSTSPFQNDLNEADARSIYAEATQIDNIRGTWPPTDTGSSGLAVAKVLLRRRLISGYWHGFGVAHAIGALQLGPGFTGFTWLTGCDTPDATGLVRYEGAVRGGHEGELVGLDAPAAKLWFANSWGEDFGAPVTIEGRVLTSTAGYFCMSVDDYARALADSGDVIFPGVPK